MLRRRIIWDAKNEAVLEISQEHLEKCTKQLAQTVVLNVKCLSNQLKENQSTAENAIENIDQADFNCSC